jgi:type II secretory ATPase GspE/PulE/Tfp pilus assembly ATPase PilB-like protein
MAIHNQSAKEIEQAVADSDFMPILDNCVELVKEGITTVEEVVRTIGR